MCMSSVWNGMPLPVMPIAGMLEVQNCQRFQKIRQIKVNKCSFWLNIFSLNKAKNAGDAGHQRGFLTQDSGKR